MLLEHKSYFSLLEWVDLFLYGGNLLVHLLPQYKTTT